MLKRFKSLLIGLGLLSICTPVLAAPIPFGGRDYIQQRKTDANYGAATTINGCINDIQPNGAQTAFVKSMWITFLAQSNEFIESGCTRSLTGLSISYDPSTQNSYYEGHYFAYNTVTAQGAVTYREGRVNLGSTPNGNFRYKTERDFNVNNRWCNFVNNTGTYCITLPSTNSSGGNYNAAGAVTVGMEFSDTSQTFTNNTKSENIWYQPFSGSGGYVRIGTMSNADNMASTLRSWYTTYTPATTTTPDFVTFKNQ